MNGALPVFLKYAERLTYEFALLSVCKDCKDKMVTRLLRVSPDKQLDTFQQSISLAYIWGEDILHNFLIEEEKQFRP